MCHIFYQRYCLEDELDDVFDSPEKSDDIDYDEDEEYASERRIEYENED